MGQHQGRLRGEDAQEMGGLAVVEAVETPTQHLAVDRDMTALLLAGLLVEDGGMAAEDLLNRPGFHLLEDPADRCVGRSAPPRQPERLAQAGEMDVDERVDGPVRVRPGHDRQDGEQHDVRQAIQLAFRSPRVLDLGQQREKRRQRLHGNLLARHSGCPE